MDLVITPICATILLVRTRRLGRGGQVATGSSAA
jgi:hypothetical protein